MRLLAREQPCLPGRKVAMSGLGAGLACPGTEWSVRLLAREETCLGALALLARKETALACAGLGWVRTRYVVCVGGLGIVTLL